MKRKNNSHANTTTRQACTKPFAETAFVIDGNGTRGFMTPTHVLAGYLMPAIDKDDAKALSNVFDFAAGIFFDPLAVELPLKELATGKESMVSMPIMCYALGKEVCFGFLIDKLLAEARQGKGARKLFHAVFGELATSLGQPGVPPVQTRMLEKLVESFMLAAHAHGQLVPALCLPMPEPVLAIGRRIASQSAPAGKSV